MIYLNFNNLDIETQEKLLIQSQKDIESRYGEDLKRYCRENETAYEDILEEETIKNLYNLKFVFKL